jgi:hypothetical protein
LGRSARVRRHRRFRRGDAARVRRNAPEGSYFEDGNRAAGVFGVLATGFAVLIGFVVFLAFESFDTSRSGAEEEARLVAQQFETAQFLPVDVRKRLAGELVCYARAVVYQEWPKLESGTLGEALNPWAAATFRTMRTVEPRLASEQTAYDKWFDERSDRESARADRTHGAGGRDSGSAVDRLVPQRRDHLCVHAALRRQRGTRVRAGNADGRGRRRDLLDAALVVPRQPVPRGDIGGLRPTAMERALDVVQEEAHIAGGGSPPCVAVGNARG